MTFPTRLAVLALALSALSACGQKDSGNTDSTKAAAGAALLPRSVSDDMPAYDTVRSQAQREIPLTASDDADAPPRASADEPSTDTPENSTAAAAATSSQVGGGEAGVGEAGVGPTAIKPAGE